MEGNFLTSDFSGVKTASNPQQITYLQATTTKDTTRTL